tara:strand:- start:80 stop:736 length:657 start_codon:yes stop_codon:yes gene_type:complete
MGKESKDQLPCACATESKNRRNSYRGLDPQIIKIVRGTVSFVIGKLGFREHDRADLEQELMLALHLGLESYTPDKSKLATFARCIVKRCMHNIIKARLAPNGYHQRCKVSLDEEFVCDAEDGGMALIDLVDTDGMLRIACYNVTNTPADQVNTRMELDWLFSGLSPEERSICLSMAMDEPNATEEKHKISHYLLKRLQFKFYHKLKGQEIFVKNASIP